MFETLVSVRGGEGRAGPAAGTLAPADVEPKTVRAEIDTSAPFESVREAVDRFGGSAVWKSQLKQLFLREKHHCSEEGELMQVGEETRRLEMDLTVKERETLEVLKELEMTKRVVDGLKLKLQEATPEVVKIPELNPDTMKVLMNHVESIGPKQQHPGMILMELKQAKMNLNRTTSGLAGIRASVELLKSQIEEEKLLLGKTRERLSSNTAVISSLEEEVNRAQLDLQIIKDAKQMNPDPEVSKLSAEIDSTMASVKTAEIRLLAARKMEVDAKVALEKIKALPTNAADVMILPMREYTMLTLKAQEAEEISRKKIEAAMLRVEEANQSKQELLTKVEEATLEVETSRKALEEALKREEDANSGKLAVETALRRWRSEQAQKRRCSTKFKNPYPNRRMLDVNGLSLAPSGPALLSIGEILSRKLNGPEEYEAAIQEKMNRKPKVSLGQILSRRHGLLSPQRTDDDDDDKKSSEKRKRLGFSFHFGKHIKKSKKKKRRPGWDPRVNCRPKLLLPSGKVLPNLPLHWKAAKLLRLLPAMRRLSISKKESKMATRSRVEAIVSSIITVHPNEIPALIHSAACFFFLLSAYFVILPLRDDGAISLGLNSLPGLFVGSLLLTLVAAPVSTLVFSLPNLSKPRALVLIHRFFSMSLLAFFVLWYASSTERQPSSSKVSDSHPSLYKNENDNAGQGGPTRSGGWVNHGWFYIFVRIGLFLWVALLNLITISSTWARVIDVMDSESGSRLFGFVGAGATLGQLFGSLFAASMAWLGPFLLLFSALFMELAAQSSKGIIQDARYISEELSPMREDVRDQNTETGDETISALVQSSPKSPTYVVKPRLCVMLEGLWLIMSSTYLLYVSLFLWLSAVVSSFFYFQKVTIIAMSVTSPLARRRLFALINSSIAVFILAGQLTLTGRILTVAGVTVAICSAPFVAIVNLVALDVWPTWLTVAISETLRKVTTYVVTRPGREILFTVVSQDEKYKAKVCIDVIVQRLGDATAAGIYQLLFGTVNKRTPIVSLYALPVCFLWVVTAFHLGRRHASLAKLQAIVMP